MSKLKWTPPPEKLGCEFWSGDKRYVLVHGPRRSGKSLEIAARMQSRGETGLWSYFAIITRLISKGMAGIWKAKG